MGMLLATNPDVEIHEGNINYYSRKYDGKDILGSAQR